MLPDLYNDARDLGMGMEEWPEALGKIFWAIFLSPFSILICCDLICMGASGREMETEETDL